VPVSIAARSGRRPDGAAPTRERRRVQTFALGSQMRIGARNGEHLGMVIAVDPNTTVEYVLREDRSLPREQQTVFLVKPLTLQEEHEVPRVAANDGHEGGTLILVRGLRGWSNLRDAAGADVPFEGDSKGNPTRACLARLTSAQRTELGLVIHAGCQEEQVR
jgi:hypothetical protein